MFSENAIFDSRKQAGEQLAIRLEKYRRKPAIIYALPRGGVILGAVIARSLGAKLSLVIPRKIGHPLNPEYAIGAVTETGEPVLNEAEAAALPPEWLKRAIGDGRVEAGRRREVYLGKGLPLPARGKIAIIVDDGIATGLTMLSATDEIKQQQPARTIVAVPVLPKEAVLILEKAVDEVIAVDVPKFYRGAVGAYYRDFPQVSDQEVISLLGAS